MRAPGFWRHGAGPSAQAISTALLPIAGAVAVLGWLRRRWARPMCAGIPVICVGNLVAGGAGKTPVALALAALLTEAGQRPHFLTRGYGGSLEGPVRVDPPGHDFRAVGDEALLLARAAPVWVARDRAEGALAARAGGASVVVMDDGLQNPHLAQDLSILVIDGGYGFGNGRVMPAGPLRETLASGLARVRAAILLGEDETGALPRLAGRVPVLRAALVPMADASAWRGRRVVAFAGIGRPEKFFATLAELGADIQARVAFADHHPYHPVEIRSLLDRARRLDAMLATTEKDWVRLPPDLRAGIAVLPVRVAWRTPADADAAARLLALDPSRIAGGP